MSEPYIGEIRVTSFNFPPRGWAFCNGQLLSIQQNQALFSILGTTYGGNGINNFALPNLQGKTPLHTGGSHALGQTGGEAAHTLSATEMPQHTHLGNAQSAPATPGGDTPSGALPAAGPAAIYGTSPSVPMSGAAVTASGGSQPHENQPPYLVLSMMIALQGIYPSQN